MKTSRYNGIMMNIRHEGKMLHLQKQTPGYLVTELIPIKDGTRHNRYPTGDLNKPKNLKEFLDFLQERLKI